LAHFFGSALSAPLQILTIGLFGAATFVSAVLPELPDVQSLRKVQFREPLKVFSADGALIAEFGVERRRPVAIAKIPPLIINAFLATEDSRFFEHGGVDTIGIGRALLSYLNTGEKAQGASTITMQVTRNFFLTPEKTFSRKLKEILLTLHVEQTLSKQEILELYLNQIFFGHRSYGISAAASLYYDKGLDQLTVAEVAMLAGIPKAPSANNPVTNPTRALDRRNYILGRMYDLGYINVEQYDIALKTPDAAKLHRRQPELDAGHVGEMARSEIAKFYGEEALSQGFKVTTTVESWLQNTAQDALRASLRQYDRRHGYRGPEDRAKIAAMSDSDMDDYLIGVTRIPGLEPGLVTRMSSNGAEVYLGRGQRIKLPPSAMSWARSSRNIARWRGPKRKAGDAVLAGDLIRLKTSQDGGWELTQLPRVAGALVSVSPRDGAVRALVGGYSFNETKFNRAVDMRRQPGSSFKPFIYAAALHKGWTPASTLRDEAVRLPPKERWNPQNSDHKQLGAIRMRKALALSRNLATINLLQSIGIDDAQAFIRQFGFGREAMPLGLSMALGTGVLSPIKLAEGYAVFANGGYHVVPYFIKRIENAEGRVIFEADPPQACGDCWFKVGEASAQTQGLQPKNPAELVIDPRIAYQMNSLLREVIDSGTGTRAKKIQRTDVVGKTGTTNDIRDSWFAGYQANYVVVAWMGFDDFGKLGRGEEGGKAALGMWVDFMDNALKDQPIAKLDAPAGMVQVQIEGGGKGGKSKGGVTEMVAEESRDAVSEPETAKLADADAAPKPPKKTTVKRSAPRVMDDLF
jgi:penicillin-binding protein 1A